MSAGPDEIRDMALDAVLRIPKDLLTWDRQIRKAVKAEDLNALYELSHYKSYYEGKVMAYTAILNKLGMSIKDILSHTKGKKKDCLMELYSRVVTQKHC